MAEHYCQRLLKARNGSKQKWDSRPFDDEISCGKIAHFQLGEQQCRERGHSLCIGYWVCAEHYNEYMESEESKWA